MKKTKICHMTSAHPPEDVRIFHKECISLAKAGYEVFLVERGESYDKDGVHIVGVGEMPSGRLKRMTEGAKRVYEAALALDCDVYHFHDPELLPYGLKLKKKGKKVIFDSHENTADAILEKQYLPTFIRNVIHTIFVYYQNNVCQKLDAVVTVTPSMTKAFSNINPNVVEVRNYPHLKEEYTPPRFEKNNIVFAGGISKQWNHHVVLKVLEQFPGCTYCLCGSCDEKYLAELQNMPAWSQVDFLGKIPHSEVPKVLSEATIGVALLQPGKNTDGENGTMGNTKIFEEMMAGLPIICTNFKLWSEFVDRYSCGICVDPTNPVEISEAISFILSDPEQAKKMGKNGRMAVEHEFNWDQASLPLKRLYSDLIQPV